MRGLVVAVVLGLGCGGNAADAPSRVPPSAVPRAASVDPLRVEARRAEARALELGTGGTRDYRRAAQLYDELCAAGCGDADACRELVALALNERGTVMTPARLVIPARLCDRGDQVACWVASLFGVRDPSTFKGELTALCAAGDRKACDASVVFDIGDVGDVLARPRPLAACNGGSASGCASLFSGLWAYCLARDIAPGRACVDLRATEWRTAGGDPAPLLASWAQVQALCARGEAEACDSVPGRELDESARCDAGDFARCESLANQGDDRAARVACAGGITERCTPPRPRPSTGGAEALATRDRCAKGDVAACQAAMARTQIPACPP